MALVYKNRYISIFFNKKTKLLTTLWYSESEEMSKDEMQDIIVEVANQIKINKPKLYLADNRKRFFKYTKDIQKWVAVTLSLAAIEVNLQKFAIIAPEDLIIEFATHQTTENAKDVPIEKKYFKNKNLAFEWLGIEEDE